MQVGIAQPPGPHKLEAEVGVKGARLAQAHRTRTAQHWAPDWDDC